MEFSIIIKLEGSYIKEMAVQPYRGGCSNLAQASCQGFQLQVQTLARPSAASTSLSYPSASSLIRTRFSAFASVGTHNSCLSWSPECALPFAIPSSPSLLPCVEIYPSLAPNCLFCASDRTTIRSFISGLGVGHLGFRYPVCGSCCLYIILR